METIEEIDLPEVSTSSNKSFFQHMFEMNAESKSELMNIVQYSVLAIIPIVLLNKGVISFFPEADETKGSVELVAEVLGQVATIFVGMYFIHRLITFVPTYSGVELPSVNLVQVSLAFLVIVLSLQSKLGEKVSILTERVVELWDGKVGSSSSKKEESVVKVSQPITSVLPQPTPTHQVSRADYTETHNQMRPIPQQPVSVGHGPASAPAPHSMHQSPPPSNPQPNFDSMFQEPMAANEAFGSGFGSAF